MNYHFFKVIIYTIMYYIYNLTIKLYASQKT